MRHDSGRTFVKARRNQAGGETSWLAKAWDTLNPFNRKNTLADDAPADPLYAAYFDELDEIGNMAGSGVEPDNRFRAVFTAHERILTGGASALKEDFGELSALMVEVREETHKIFADHADSRARTMAEEVKRKRNNKRDESR